MESPGEVRAAHFTVPGGWVAGPPMGVGLRRQIGRVIGARKERAGGPSDKRPVVDLLFVKW